MLESSSRQEGIRRDKNFPPPPTNAARYLISLSRKDLSTIGLEFEATIPSSIHPNRSIGAKVKSISKNEFTARNNIRVGDVLYRINGFFIKTEFFHNILDMLRYDNQKSVDHNQTKLSMILERSPSSGPRQRSNQSTNNAINKKAEDIPSSVMRHKEHHQTLSEKSQKSSTRRVSFLEGNEKDFQTKSSTQSKFHPSSTQKTSVFSPCDYSREEEIIRSIFSPTVGGLASLHQITPSENNEVFSVETDQRSTTSQNIKSNLFPTSSLPKSYNETTPFQSPSIPIVSDTELSRPNSEISKFSTSSRKTKIKRVNELEGYGIMGEKNVQNNLLSPDMCYSASSIDQSNDMISPLGTNIVTENDELESTEEHYAVPVKEFAAPIFRGFDDNNTTYSDENTRKSNILNSSIRLKRANLLPSSSSLSDDTFLNDNKENVDPFPREFKLTTSGSIDVSCTLSSLYHSQEDELNNRTLDKSIEREQSKRYHLPQNDVSNAFIIERSDEGNDELRRTFDSALSNHANIVDDMEYILRERDSIQSNLSQEVKNLRNQLTRTQDDMMRHQTLHVEIITELETEKENLKQDIAILDEMVVSSSAEAREVRNKMKEKTEDFEALQRALDDEKSQRKRDLAEAEETKKKLLNKIDELSLQLRKQIEETNVACEKVEKEMKKKYDVENNAQKLKISQLTRKLAETHMSLDKVQQKNDDLSTKVKSLEEQVRQSLILEDVMSHVHQAENATILITKALEESEKELVLTKEINDLSEQRCEELKNDYEKMVGKNEMLSGKVSQVTNELKDTRETVKKLNYDMKVTSSNWKTTEKNYTSQINHLKWKLHQVTSSNTDSKIPKFNNPTTNKNMDIVGQKNKVNAVTPPSTLTRENDFEDNKEAKQLCKEGRENGNVQLKEDQVYKRIATVRALGGRAALQAKLKKSRGLTSNSKPLKNISNENPVARARFPFQNLSENRPLKFQQNRMLQGTNIGKENLKQ